MEKLKKIVIGMGGLCAFGNMFINGLPDNRVDTIESSWKKVGEYLQGAIDSYEQAQKTKG
ncbi:MAG: hypothetical protein LBT51_05800 [Fusobacteriaceae bacterium]|jgi:hypothetical protein|nr:hypothetical protein [Fusobacteriaceae bacterium]